MALGDISSLSFTNIGIGALDADLKKRVGIVLDSIAGAQCTLRLYTVDRTGATTSLGDTNYTIDWDSMDLSDTPTCLCHVKDDIWVVVAEMYRNAAPNYYRALVAITVEADSSGFVSGVLDTLAISTQSQVGDATGPYHAPKDIISIPGTDYFAIPYFFYDNLVTRSDFLAVVQIDDDGTMTTKDNDYMGTATTYSYPCACRLDDNIIIMAGYPNVYTASISKTDGTITALDSASPITGIANGISRGQLNSDGTAYIVSCVSVTVPGGDGKLNTFEVSLDGTSIGSVLGYLTLGNSGNRNNCYIVQVDNYSNDSYQFWASTDSGDGDLDVGVSSVDQNGDITWEKTYDSKVGLPVAAGGPIRNVIRELWHNPFGDWVHYYAVSTDEGFSICSVQGPSQDDGIYVVLDDYIEIQDYVFAIRTDRGKDDELGSVATGICELTCDNYNGDFSPQNTSGAFYGILDLGVKVSVYEVYGGVWYGHFTGKIESIVPRARPDDLSAVITCYDRMDDLAGTTIEAEILEDTDDSAAIAAILDAYGWESFLRDLDNGVDDYEIWWAHAETPLSAINKIVECSRGMFYIDVNGDAIYENRHHRLKDPHLTSQYDFNENLADIDYQLSKKNVLNISKVTGHLYSVKSTAEQPMWSVKTGVAGAPYIAPSSSITIWANANGPIESITALVEGTHWEANSQYDGLGSDMSGDVSLDSTTVYGQAIKFVFSNANSTTGAYLVHPSTPPAWASSMTDQTIFVEGYLYDDFPFTIEREDTISQGDYGIKSTPINCAFIGNVIAIESYADWLINSFKYPFPNPVMVTIMARTSTAIRTQCLARKISDRITIASTTLGIDQDFYINRVQQDYVMNEGGTIHITKYQLEATESLGGPPGGDLFWLLEVAGYSEIGETTWLGF